MEDALPSKEIDLIHDKVFDYLSPYGEYANRFKKASYSYSEYNNSKSIIFTAEII